MASSRDNDKKKEEDLSPDKPGSGARELVRRRLGLTRREKESSSDPMPTRTIRTPSGATVEIPPAENREKITSGKVGFSADITKPTAQTSKLHGKVGIAYVELKLADDKSGRIEQVTEYRRKQQKHKVEHQYQVPQDVLNELKEKKEGDEVYRTEKNSQEKLDIVCYTKGKAGEKKEEKIEKYTYSFGNPEKTKKNNIVPSEYTVAQQAFVVLRGKLLAGATNHFFVAMALTVDAAGDIAIANGMVTKFSNQSGGYRAEAEAVKEAMRSVGLPVDTDKFEQYKKPASSAVSSEEPKQQSSIPTPRNR